MMLVAHEAQELKELTMSCVNTITNMAYYRSHVQDPELKAMIDRHWSAHIQDYNMKVQFMTQPTVISTPLPIPDLNVSITEIPINNYSQATPRTDLSDFNDREMATAYLLTLKRAGREYAWSAMEASHSQIRRFLEDAFLMASRHAYDVWQWMVKRGYYPVEAAPEQDLISAGQMYQVVQDPMAQPKVNPMM